MRRYAALFASISVEGKRLKMADLRAAFEAEGLSRVETVVSSDNVLFDHPERPEAGLEEKLAHLMRARFAMTTAVLVRSREALAAAIAGNPFAAAGGDNAAATLFLDGPVTAQDFALHLADRRGAEQLAPGDRALHIDRISGAAERRQVGAFIERRLGRRGTVRDLRSIARILAKMDES